MYPFKIHQLFMLLNPFDALFFLSFHVSLLQLAPSEDDIENAKRITFRADQIWMVSVALRDVCHLAHPDETDASQFLLLDLY